MAKTDKNAGALEAMEQAVNATEAEMRAQFPHLAAAIEAAKSNGDKTPVALRVRAKADGYRRGGFRFSTEAMDLPLPEAAQLNAIFGDKDLLAEFVFADAG